MAWGSINQSRLPFVSIADGPAAQSPQLRAEKAREKNTDAARRKSERVRREREEERAPVPLSYSGGLLWSVIRGLPLSHFSAELMMANKSQRVAPHSYLWETSLSTLFPSELILNVTLNEILGWNNKLKLCCSSPNDFFYSCSLFIYFPFWQTWIYTMPLDTCDSCICSRKTDCIVHDGKGPLTKHFFFFFSTL